MLCVTVGLWGVVTLTVAVPPSGAFQVTIPTEAPLALKDSVAPG